MRAVSMVTLMLGNVRVGEQHIDYRDNGWVAGPPSLLSSRQGGDRKCGERSGQGARPLDQPSVAAARLPSATSRPGTPIVTARRALCVTLKTSARTNSRNSLLVHSAGSRQGSAGRSLSRLEVPAEEEEEGDQDLTAPRDFCTETTQSSSSPGEDTKAGFSEDTSLVSSPSAPTAPCPHHHQHPTTTATRVLSTALYRARHSRYCRCASGEGSVESAEAAAVAATMVEGKVVFSTSHDPTFPPTAILDGRNDTYWASSGLYPQVVVVSLPTITSVTSLDLLAYNVRKVVVARSVKNQPTDFEDVIERELPHDEGKLQNSVLSSEPMTASHLKITIVEGHDHFCSVHKVTVVGSATSAGGQAGLGGVTKNITRDTPMPPKPATPHEPASPLMVRQRSPRQVLPMSDPLTLTPAEDEEEEEDDEDMGVWGGL
ncbi:hypothetical protein Pcinc_021262 [Petrolisthes cinctipes]|uniref:F5/8 type C domain-containing protein n=1 Tax=Petrolisthes cinctipes TaxID=88211 RepID=A0AAE1FHY2_PETCI|nr:hypothetical protein Pcinc_021262 [Petrolisthes cinctipes]